MTQDEDVGQLCVKCGDMFFGDRHTKHIKLHNLEIGDKIKVTFKQDPECVAIAKKVDDLNDEDVQMFKLIEITHDGEDVTESYTEKIGDTRGIPHSDIGELMDDIEILES